MPIPIKFNRPGNSGSNVLHPEGKRFVQAFGEQGAVWFVEGKTFEQAQALHNATLGNEIHEMKAANAELRKKLDAAPCSEGEDLACGTLRSGAPLKTRAEKFATVFRFADTPNDY